MNRKKLKRGLGFKFSLGLTVFGVVITLAVGIIGTELFSEFVVIHYQENAYQAAGTVSEYFNENDIKYYVDLVTRYNKGEADKKETDAAANDEDYRNIITLTEKLRKNINASDICVCAADIDLLENFNQQAYDNNEWKPLYYIIDCNSFSENSFLLGEAGTIPSEFRTDVINSFYSGSPSKEDYKTGYTISAFYPMTAEGKTIAFVIVSIPMTSFKMDLLVYITAIVLVAGIVSVILIIIANIFLKRTMIKPVIIVAEEAGRFNGDNSAVSEKLGSINTHDEIQQLSESILKMQTGIKEYISNITRITVEKERISAELNIAAQIQSDMLPGIFPAFPEKSEFEIYASMTPAKEVGGDFYDFFLIDDDHLALVIADVSGKGVPASLFMVIAKTLIKNRAMMGGSPSEILSHVNNQLCEGNEAEMFVTVWLCIVEISTGKCIASNAGHEYPAIKRANGNFELYKQKHSVALAVMEDIRFRQYEFELSKGDIIYVYTDGVTEATNTDNKLFGTDRMLDALNINPASKPEQLIAAVHKKIDEFILDAPQFDDITMLCLYYNGK